MKKITLALILTICTSLLLMANDILYVTQTGTGNGESWEDASSDLNAILFKAKPSTQVWVAAGIYFPTTDTDRKVSFYIPQNVAVYGGFSGEETKLTERNILANTTILSGNIGTALFDDNSYNVVYFENATPSTILDGFTIQDGNGDGTGTTAARNRCGAGIYNNGAKGVSNPTIANCILINNVSRDGGAVYNNGITGEASPRFIACSFYSNKANFDGGAIFNDGRKGGRSNPIFMSCIIKQNHANYGGALCNYAGAGEASPLYENCEIIGNTATKRGAGVYHMDIDASKKVEFIGRK